MKAPPQTTDAELIAHAVSGSQQAFRRLYRVYAQPVYWIAHGLVRTDADAQDVTQETFVTAWRKLPGLRLEGESLLPWLATICRFHAANRLRSMRRHLGRTEPLTEAADAQDVEKSVIDRALAERIVDQLAEMSELDRTIFILCATEGVSYDDAAERLGVAHGTVRNRLSRVRTQLRTAAKESES